MNLRYLARDVLAVIGAVYAIVKLLNGLFALAPRLNSLRSSAYRWAHGRWKHQALEKRAISSNIEGVLNESVAFLQRELPPGWMSKAKIEWVREETLDHVEEDELILRIKPLSCQDENLMNSILCFFTKAVFREVREVVPPVPREAAVLQLSRRTMTKHHPYALGKFERMYVEPAIQTEQETTYYLGHYNTMDSRGYFTGVYLREATDLAARVRYSAQRGQIGTELREIVDHVSRFTQAYGSNIPEELWSRRSELSSYGLLLVARPFASRQVHTYVNNARHRAGSDIRRLYVLGAAQERSFVRRVITAIARSTPYALLEVFELNKDYRGDSGGICAVFDLAAADRAADRQIADFFDEG